MIRIKDRLKVQAVLSNMPVESPQLRHKLVSVVLGMVMGERLNLFQLSMTVWTSAVFAL